MRNFAFFRGDENLNHKSYLFDKRLCILNFECKDAPFPLRNDIIESNSWIAEIRSTISAKWPF